MSDVTRLDINTGRSIPLDTDAGVSDLPRGVTIHAIFAIDIETILGVGSDTRVYLWSSAFAVWKLKADKEAKKKF